MDYEADLNGKLIVLSKKLPHFSDGRIDYTYASEAVVIVVFLRFRKKILILHRSQKVLNYQGKWGGLGGFVDEAKPIREKVLLELNEELNINSDIIHDLTVFSPITNHDNKINKTWFIYPVLVDLNKSPTITLDWEHDDYKWILPLEVTNFDITPNTEDLLSSMQLI